jgi:hypothetical protein
VKVQDDINFLLHFVGPGEKLNAELWHGSIIRMEYNGDDADIVLIPENSPAVVGPQNAFWGAIIILGGYFSPSSLRSRCEEGATDSSQGLDRGSAMLPARRVATAQEHV